MQLTNETAKEKSVIQASFKDIASLKMLNKEELNQRQIDMSAQEMEQKSSPTCCSEQY